MNQKPLYSAEPLQWRRGVAACLAGVLTIGALALSAGLGCGGNELPPGFGESTPVSAETPESFDLAWQIFDQLTVFNLVRSRTSEEDPLISDNPQEAQPQPLVYAKQISLPVARERVVSHLNNWILSLHGGDDWQRDPMLERLPTYLKDNPGIRTLDDLHFHLEDFDYLQQCLWLRDISNWGTKSPPGALTSRTLAEAKASLSSEGSGAENGQDAGEVGRNLEAAVKLFDWTVRNIQLDPLLPEQRDVTAGPGGSRRRVLAAEMGVPGPGYSATPGQVLLFGHGDAWQRARVFILLLRQSGIEAAMLAFQDTGPAEKHRPWLPAASIGGKLYLFEPALGLPLPGPEGKGIATLDQVLAQPELLRQMDVEDGAETLAYPVKADDLKALVALIDAESAAVCRRMEMVEKNLSGHRKVVLTTSPSRTAEKFATHDGIKFARLWSVPLEAPVYVEARHTIAMETLGKLANGEQVSDDLMGVLAEIQYQNQVFGDMLPVCVGRYDLLQGKFKTGVDDPGATGWLQDSLQPDAVIDKLDISAQARRELGVDPKLFEQMDEQQQAMWAQETAGRLRSIKRQASIWLGQTMYELGDFGTSINWLKRVDDNEDNPWRYTARYNTARAYEAEDKIDEARRIYLLDESPQKHGNRLRARMLREIQLKGGE